MKRSAGAWLVGVTALIWLMAIVSGYYIYHKPFPPASAAKLFGFGLQLTVAFGLVTLAGGLGRFGLAKLLKAELFNNPALQAALGLGGLGLIWLATSATLGISIAIAWGLWLALGVLLHKNMLEWLKALKEEIVGWKPHGKMQIALAIGNGVILLVTLMTAAAPPVKFDALVYHLALPQIYIDQGRMVFVADNPFWGMPQTGEMLYTWCMALAGLTTAPILGWISACLALLGLGGMIKSRWGARYGWIGISSLIAGFTFASSMAWAYIDWLVLLFSAGMLAAMEIWMFSREPKYIGLAGGFAGMALGTKYTAGIIILAGAVVLAMELFHNQKKQVGSTSQGIYRYPAYPALQTFTLFLGSAVAISLPWWVKNWLATGYLFYPLWGRTVGVNPFSIQPALSATHMMDWLNSLFLPFRMTIQGVENAPGYSASVSPLLLGLAPFAFYHLKKRTSEQGILIRLVGVISLSGLLIWTIASRLAGLLEQTRLYYALFPAFTILAAAGFYALERLRLARLRLGRVIFGLVLLVFGLNVVQVAISGLDSTAPQLFLGLSSNESYLAKNLGWYYPAMDSIRKLPADSRVLMLWEGRGLYCLPECSPDSYLDTWKNLMKQVEVRQPPHAVVENLTSKGYTHVLYYRSGAEFVRSDDPSYQFSDWQRLEAFLDGLPQPTRFGDAYLLYPLK